MGGRTIPHEDLDHILDTLAEDPDSFSENAEELAAQLEAEGADHEITDPLTWRRSDPDDPAGSRVALQNQFRVDVDAFQSLDRENEARLARRIEFLRIRLERAAEQAGLTGEELRGNVSGTPSAWLDGSKVDCAVMPTLCRRQSELHALRSEMVERNLYLVLINVERYSHTSASRQDLTQEGAAALFRAVDGFDWRRGLLFRTYAVHWLNQAFRSYLYNFGSTVRVPVYLQKALKHINQAIERIGDRGASVGRIAEEAGLAESMVSSALTASRSIHSIDTPLGGDDDEGSSLREAIGNTEEEADPYSTDLEDISLEEGIQEALERLSDRERFVVSKRFGVGVEREHTLAEVAAELGVSLERVRQIQVRAISKMNTPALRRAVDPFLN